MFTKLKKKNQLRKYENIAKKVEDLDGEMSKLSDDELSSKTEEFRKRLDKGESLEDIKVEAFAVVREATFRVLGKKHYPVQIIGGLALHDGYVAEMKTGEGKTLTELLPAYLNALNNKVHIITVNDYLAERDSDEMGKVFDFLNISSGCINDQHPLMKQQIYKKDVVYGTSKEFGFDYLRDNMAKSNEDKVMQKLGYVIIDEVDSVLIDESRTPLIISESGEDATQLYLIIDMFIKSLERGEDIKESESYYEKMVEDLSYFESDDKGDFRVDPKRKNAIFTENGLNKIEEYFYFEDASEKTTFLINHLLQQSLKANYVMEKDVDYIVNKKGEVLIVDTFTGRAMPGRRFSDGLHQAIEAKERVEIKKESRTIATITLQNFFSLYDKVSGMTGTGETEEKEFIETYGLKVLPIPTNKPVIRKDKEDIVFLTEEDKYESISRRVKNSNGRPILIGVPSIEKSEKLSQLFRDEGIHHRVLNAKNHQAEAYLIAQAGKVGAVTIATNMAGRGTDIMLGGNPDYMAAEKLSNMGYSGDEILFAEGKKEPETKKEREVRKLYRELVKEYEKETEEEKEEVKELGGLLVIGTEKHESRRIDNQLRGRAGRQGDPGESVFIISIEDEMYHAFGGGKIKDLMLDENNKIEKDDEFYENGIKVSKTIKAFLDNAQIKNEEHNYSSRKNVLEYDNVLHEQREYVYKLRNQILDEEENKAKDVYEKLIDYAPEEIIKMVKMFSNTKEDFVKQINFIIDKLGIEIERINKDTTEKKLKEDLAEVFKELYNEKRKESEEAGNKDGDFERFALLEIIDKLWVQYLTDVNNLKNSTSMSGLGRTNPIDTFKKESSELFDLLITSLAVESANILYSIQVMK